MLEAIDIDFDYDDVPVLDKVSLSLMPGKVLYLRGRNGAGKTTLLQCLAGLKTPMAGNIYYNGRDIDTNLTEYQSQLMFIGHRSGLSDALTVTENCLLNLNVNFKPEELEAILAQVQLSSFSDTSCSQLSAGQKRRVALCQLQGVNKKIWLLDEPLTALDTQGIELLTQWIERHLREGGMVVMTSHQPLAIDSHCIEEYQL